MSIQSISVVVPTKGCVNSCPFCVSKMHENPYPDFSKSHKNDNYSKRLKFAANNRVNTLIITGSGEPLQNIRFLNLLSNKLEELGSPFPNIEIQTTGGILLAGEAETGDIDSGSIRSINKYYSNIERLKKLGVTTISLSISDIFDSCNNWEIIGGPKSHSFRIPNLCNIIKDEGFNLRLSLNMTYAYSPKCIKPSDIISKCKELGADQITFRKLYYSGDNSPESLWVKANQCHPEKMHEINKFIECNGEPLYKLPFGPIAYSIMGMSTVVDRDCMSKDSIDSLKYIILRENGKLYCRWDDEGSLLF